MRVTRQSSCPLFREGDKMVVRLPEIDTGSGTVCAYAAAQALPMLAAAARANLPAESVISEFRCISGGDHFAEFEIASAAMVQSVETKVERALRQVDYLGGLSRLDMEKIVALLQTDQYFPRSCLIEQDRPADRIVLVTRGVAEIVGREKSGFERLSGRVGEGEVFGAAELVEARPHATSLRCLTIVCASVLLRRDLLELIERDPEIAHHLRSHGF